MAKVFWNPNVVGGSNNGTSWEDAYIDLVTAASNCSSGDVLVMAENAGDTGAAITIAFSNSTAWNTPIYVISSEVLTGTSINYRRSTSSQYFANSAASDDVTVSGENVVMFGVYLSANDNIGTTATGTTVTTYETNFDFGQGAAGQISVGTRSKLVFNESDTSSVNNAASVIGLGARAVFKSLNSTFKTSDATAGATNQIIDASEDSVVEICGCDFSSFVINNFIALVNTDNVDVKIFATTIDAAQTSLLKTEEIAEGSHVEIYVTDSSLTNRFYVLDNQGRFESDTGTYLNNNISVEATTFSHAAEWYNPARMKLTEFSADFSTAKTIDIEIAQDGTTTGLNDQEIWFEVHYPDSTTTTLLVDDNKAAQPESGATTHPTSTASWTGLSGTNAKQKMSVTTTGTGREGVAIVYLCVAKPSTTVYVDPQITVT